MAFTATVTGSPPLTHTWDFGGDGTAAEDDTLTPVFTYTNPGTYTVTLTVENPCGSDTISQTVEVLCVEPEAGFVTNDPVLLGEPMAFTATVTGSPPLTHTWDFGGDGIAVGDDTLIPVFTYTNPGTYSVTLAVENPCGSDTISQTVEVLCVEPGADLVTNSPVPIGQPMMFTATVTGTPPLTYTWDFGGDGAAAGENTFTPVFTYTGEGVYTVTLTLENACGFTPISSQVEVVKFWYHIYFPWVVRE
jgi:PKD repeat protein